jgi:hypothetical protein
MSEGAGECGAVDVAPMPRMRRRGYTKLQCQECCCRWSVLKVYCKLEKSSMRVLDPCQTATHAAPWATHLVRGQPISISDMSAPDPGRALTQQANELRSISALTMSSGSVSYAALIQQCSSDSPVSFQRMLSEAQETAVGNAPGRYLHRRRVLRRCQRHRFPRLGFHCGAQSVGRLLSFA